MPLRDTFKEFLSWFAIDYLTEWRFNNAKLQLNNYRSTELQSFCKMICHSGRAVLIILKSVLDSIVYCYAICCTVRLEVTKSDYRDILTISLVWMVTFTNVIKCQGQSQLIPLMIRQCCLFQYNTCCISSKSKGKP